MRRREVLLGAGAGISASVAGCLSGSTGGDGETGSEDHGSALVIMESSAFYGREDGFVYGVDLVEQRERWRFDTGGSLPISITGAEGIIYAGNVEGELYALAVADGTAVWSLDPDAWSIGGQIFTPNVADGIAYAGLDDRRFYAVDAKTGERIWTFEPDHSLFPWKWAFGFTSTVHDEVAYIGMGDVLYGVDVETGAEVSRYQAPGTVSSPSAEAGVLAFGGGGTLHALDIDAWTERWRVETGAKVWFPALVEGAAYAPNEAGTLTVVDVETGDVRWRFHADGELHTPPVFTAETAFFGSHDGFLYAVDRDTGEQRWQYRTGAGSNFPGVAAAPTIVDDLVYIAAPGHTIVGIDSESGDEQIRFSH